MNRTDRLYAIVEELRANPTRPVSARRLADRFEVAPRTIERDILALQEAGVPIYAETGRTGGYLLDATRTLPPVNFTPAEAAAVAVALGAPAATPLAQSARSALAKILSVMPVEEANEARTLGAKVVRFEPSGSVPGRGPRVIEQAIVERRVVRLRYADKRGVTSERVVEPMAVIGVSPNWYLAAWCRLRDDLRTFRLDRITDATLTREVAPERRLPEIDLEGLERRPTFE
jgi:predicted DNA-binding transcriptional regulator YafY